MYKKILVTTDASPLSRKAVRHAAALSAATGARLVALHVVPRYPQSYFEGGLSLSLEDVARTERAWAERGRAIVDEAVALAQSDGVQAKGVVAQSDLVAESIMAAARKQKCDLIVMASHGRKGLKRLLLGSEALHVLTHSTIPVLILR
jgi:nucleotide-binding universal stress UspA family protein